MPKGLERFSNSPIRNLKLLLVRFILKQPNDKKVVLSMTRSFIVSTTTGILISLAIVWYLLTESNPSYGLVILGGAIATVLVGMAIAEIITGTFQFHKEHQWSMGQLRKQIAFRRKTSLLFRYSFDSAMGLVACLMIQFGFELLNLESPSKSLGNFVIDTLIWAAPLIVIGLIIDVFSGSQD